MTPAFRKLRAQLGGQALAARYDMHAIAAHARAGKHLKALREVDPEGTLPEPERERRALADEKAAQARLALAALAARKPKP